VRHNLAAATNAGMYAVSAGQGPAAPPWIYRHVGLLIHRGRTLSSRTPQHYKSALAFHPRQPNLPPLLLADLDRTSLDHLRKSYETVVQNLRMIRAPGRNVWQSKGDRSSAAALAADRKHRVLFIFSKAALPVEQLSRCLLTLPLAIQRAMYLEGGSEATLAIDTAKKKLELWGGYDAPLADGPRPAAPKIPFALGLARKGGGR
jgi:hypothetical protein